MQNMHADAAAVGARGWPWRVEQVEKSGGRGRTCLLHLSRRQAAGSDTLVAIRPHEPVSRLGVPEALVPVPAREAAAVAVAAARNERIALAVQAAARLRGDIHPWQLCAALAFERGHARVLLADEAGMGKTVSAALAIAQCLDEASDRRCLVLAPGHLLPQWRAELHHRLRIDAMALDAAALQRLQRELPAGVAAWSLPGCVIASFDFLKQPHIVHAIETATWDLLIVDEAHLACGASERHAAVSLVARRARRVLLLTATPSDGGAERSRALHAIGLARADAPLVRLRHVAAGHARVERTLHITPAAPARALHEALEAYARWIASGAPGDGAVSLLCSVLIKRALSSPHAVNLSLLRRHALLGQAPVAVQPSLFEADEDPGLLGAASGLPAGRERRRLEALIGLSARAALDDRRLRALTRLVSRAREPVVIFSCFRDTACLVAAALSPHARLRLIHGALPPSAFDAAIDAFTRGDADVLVATDVAAQGLNLQARCRWVIHYDLPWRPPSIRQRTGRVDRIGQRRSVHSTFLLDRGALSHGMRARLASLTAHMHDEDARIEHRRWDVLAAAEARRLIEVRTGACAQPPRCHGAVTVVEIDCVDVSGGSIERRVVALKAPVDEARAWGRAWGMRRRSRLRRAIAARASRRIVREHAIRDAALETVRPVLRQDGLFERRADRGRAADAEARAQVLTAFRDAIERHAGASRITGIRVRIVASFAMSKAAR